MDSIAPTPERPRTAMNCITNTHISSIQHPHHAIDKKRRFSASVRLPLRERRSFGTPRIPPQIPSKPRDGNPSETVRPCMFRPDLPEDHPNPTSKMWLLQVRRRRRYSDSSQFLPLHVHVPPPILRREPDGCFENPRKAPLPQGLQFNTTRSHPVRCLSSPSTISSPSTASNGSPTPLTVIDVQFPELKNLSQASIFKLPKFDPDKEMQKLQNLWTKKCSLRDEPPPFICRTPPRSQILSGPSQDPSERSFFEIDSDEENDERQSRWGRRRRQTVGSMERSRSAVGRAFQIN